MNEKKERNVFYIDHRGELLIWLIILLVPVVLSFFINLHHKKLDTGYKIFMPDVDGLIVGSPVRAMGIEIGHVTKIQPAKDEVFVQFIIQDKSIEIPQGTSATVEFSGMAGSKSLELYLPDKNTYVDSTVPIITPTSPKRLSDAAGLLNEMFKKIGDIITMSSRFGTKLSEIDFPEKSSSASPKEFLDYTNDFIDMQQKRVDNLGNKLNERRNSNE